MPFAVQNDSGTVTGANAYISVADLKAYHADRGNEVDGTDEEIQQAIVRATDYMDGRWRFRGEKLNSQQRTAWPRTFPQDDDQLTLVGIPVQVKEACAEYALLVRQGVILDPNPTRDVSGQTVQSKSEQVGPIASSVTFISGGGTTRPEYPIPDMKLRGLVQTGGTLARR